MRYRPLTASLYWDLISEQVRSMTAESHHTKIKALLSFPVYI